MATIDVPSPDDPVESWLVYADALQTKGDPRGALIVLNKAVADGADPADRDAYLDANADAIFGSLAAHRQKVSMEWAGSGPALLALNVGPKDDAAQLVDALLQSPLAPLMHGLRLVGHTPSQSDRVDLGPALKVLGTRMPAACTRLELIDERARNARILVSADYDAGENLVDFGSLESVWAIVHLRSLHLVVADTQEIQLGTINAPELRHFSFLGLRWAEPYGDETGMSAALAAGNFPKLESVALRIPETLTYSWPSQDGAYVRVDRYDEEPPVDDYYDDEGWGEDVDWSTELAGLLAKLRTCPLRRLSLTSFVSSANLLEALHAHGLPPTLETLDLSASDLTDDDARWMVEHQELFAGLATLDLRDTLIEDAGPLASLGPEILHSRGGGSIYEFAVGME